MFSIYYLGEVLYFYYLLMWLEFLLWFFITLYGVAGLVTFSVCIPKVVKTDDELVASNIRDYIFWLLTSVIFFLYAIFIMDDWRIVWLLVIELIIMISIFAWLVVKKKAYVISKIKKLAASKRKFF